MNSTDTATDTATGTEADRVTVPVRLDVDAHTAAFSKAMSHLDNVATAQLDKVGIDPGLRDLLRLRASQLNGCAYCVDLHSGDARKAGESERRLYALPVWREMPFFTARERAALALTEAATRLSDGPVPESVVAEAAEHFSEVELAELLWTITVINAWNRLGATARPWPLT